MRYLLFCILLFVAVKPAYSDSDTVDILGINARTTTLDGTGVTIGMVELNRPGKPGKDSAAFVHDQVNPTQVYAGIAIDTANSSYVTDSEGGPHATAVAGVMIATTGDDPGDELLEGVAPGAMLHAGATTDLIDDTAFGIAANRIARIPDMRAINLSFGRPLGTLENPDGTSQRSYFIDWSTRVHNVLYVVSATADEDFTIAIPKDNYNGITVASSQKRDAGTLGAWRQVAPDNNLFYDAEGERTSIDLMAPGINVKVPVAPNSGTETDGSSFAAPHVVGAVALLQQFANIASNPPVPNPRFQLESYKQPEVMKAILLNSADKISGVHGSAREVINKAGANWLTTSAYTSPFVSLDEEMGAGHLNVDSALDNFRPGEYDPGALTPVPRIGWDYGSVGLFGNTEYTFDSPFGGYVAITLAWDRTVQSTELAGDDTYVTGDTLFGATLNNLDVYLMPAGSNDIGNAIRASTTDDDNLEHIFFAGVPFGLYKIRVTNSGGGPEDAQDYGLAWWAGEANTAGDFDGDGDVDGRDFLKWQRGESPNPFSSGDLSAWQGNYGFGSLAAVSVPEPGCLVLLLPIAFLLTRRNAVSYRQLL